MIRQAVMVDHLLHRHPALRSPQHVAELRGKRFRVGKFRAILLVLGAKGKINLFGQIRICGRQFPYRCLVGLFEFSNRIHRKALPMRAWLRAFEASRFLPRSPNLALNICDN